MPKTISNDRANERLRHWRYAALQFRDGAMRIPERACNRNFSKQSRAEKPEWRLLLRVDGKAASLCFNQRALDILHRAIEQIYALAFDRQPIATVYPPPPTVKAAHNRIWRIIEISSDFSHDGHVKRRGVILVKANVDIGIQTGAAAGVAASKHDRLNVWRPVQGNDDALDKVTLLLGERQHRAKVKKVHGLGERAV